MANFSIQGLLLMQYVNQPNETSPASAPYSDIYFKFHETLFRGYLVIANYMDFQSIQGL